MLRALKAFFDRLLCIHEWGYLGENKKKDGYCVYAVFRECELCGKKEEVCRYICGECSK